VVFKDLYEINIEIDNKSADIPLQSAFIVLSDSIYDVLPMCRLDFNDNTFLMQEYLLTTNGLDLSINMSYKDEIDQVGTKYIIQDSRIEDRKNFKNLGGTVSVTGLHKWMDSQTLKSEGYFDRISSIVTQLSNTYTFNKKDIGQTNNQDYWYQPLVNDIDFITDYLLPYAFSPSSNQSQFYFFINNKDELYFKSYMDLYNQKSGVTLKSFQKDKQTSAKNVLRVFDKAVIPYQDNYDTYNREVYQFDSQTNDFITEEDSITDYPIFINKSLPAVKNDNLTSWIYLYESETNVGRKEANKGLKYSSMEDGYYLERYLMTINFNPLINAGSMIELDIPSPDSDTNSQKSSYMKGKFLVEKTEHVWDGDKQEIYTRIVVSRKVLEVNDLYTINSKLFKT
jgi:hypothetical protein